MNEYVDVDIKTFRLVKKHIKDIRQNDFPENMQKSADIAESIMRFYFKNNKISVKQFNVIERFLDSMESFEFNYILSGLYQEYLDENMVELESVYF